MGKRINLIFILIMCTALLFQGYPAYAADQSTPTPKQTASPEPTNEPTYNTKYTVKKIKKPPYCITVNGNENQDFSTQPWNVGCQTQINIVGQRDEDGIAGEWQYYITFSVMFAGDMTIEELEGGMAMGFTAQLDGSGKGDMIDLVAKKQKEAEEKKNESPPLFPSETPKTKPTPIHTDPNTIKNSQTAPKELYQTEFDVDLSGTIQNLGPNTVYGQIGKGDQQFTVHADFLPEDTNVNTKAKIKLIVDSNNNVVAYVESDGKTYGPYAGVFTCEEDLDIQRRDSGTWPIWGVWTDVNPYEPMPNVEKDVKTITDQMENGETPKKINYPEGRWVTMKQGKKDNPSTYATVQVSKDDITYESGEIWPYPGSAMFKPTALTVYSKDLQTVIKSSKPMDYEQVITYHTANDTISYPGFGNLIRVRDSNLLGVWSSKGNLEMPNINGKADVPAGTWYEFVRATGDDADKARKGYSAAYTFTRITVNNDKSMVIDKGNAIIIPIADDEIVTLSGIKSEKVDSKGKKIEEGLDREDEILSVSDADKSAGTIKFNLAEYTSIPGLKVEGDWSAMDPSVGPPDVKNGSFKVRDKNGDAIDPPNDAQWIKFDSKKKTFEWTRMLADYDGILVEKGSYRTFGEDLLLLTDIKGTFYPRPGTGVQGFNDKDNMYGEKLLQVEQKNDENKNPVSLEFAGTAKFTPVVDSE